MPYSIFGDTNQCFATAFREITLTALFANIRTYLDLRLPAAGYRRGVCGGGGAAARGGGAPLAARH